MKLKKINSSHFLKESDVLQVNHLKTEYHFNPIGIETQSPRLSWKIQSSGKNVVQTAYRIKCAGNQNDLKSEIKLNWNSGIIQSDQSIHIEYGGEKLNSSQRIWWTVKVWDNQGNESEWSAPAFWEMGLLKKTDWIAKWIEPNLKEDTNKSNPCPLLRKEFAIHKKISKATVYTTSRGLYQIKINGEKVGDEELTPGWTSYHKRLQYQCFDATQQIKQGENAVGAILGDGWYRGFFGWQGKKNLYGEKTAFLFQLKIYYTDGTEDLVISDNTWKTSSGAILESEIYHGEIYDARLEKTGWNLAGFND